MNILGVGPWEVIAILAIMLVVAGPKRMILWAYELGRYVAKFRAMFAETVEAINKELQETGLEIPKNAPLTIPKFDILGEAQKVINNETTMRETSATTNTTTEPNPDAAKDEDDKPRYDSWLPD
ncbi:MAG: hypothetical protein ABI947_11725 [Chloroflexota bacterium]